ncbi:MAG: hypothetical protein MUC35_03145 [Candidatus Margulisbacteria bacterium]|nr:hypothetical protein [Candidatus Margulisiibacteriota bacterium]
MAFLVAISYGCAILSKNGTALLIFPSIKPLIDNMWAAFIGFLLASFAREALSNRSISESTVINDALQEINPKIFALIDKLADKANANPNLIKAVAVTENLQRPAWFRLIEQIMSWFSKKGTYGIMQVQSDRYLTDEESIEIAINKYFVNTKNASNEEIEAILTKYNPSTTYQDIVLKTMRYLLPG